MGKAAAAVEIINLSMQFGNFQALNRVNLRVKPGSVHALLGENGAGKSTLVKCVMGFYQATFGNLLIDDKEVRFADPKDAQQHGLGMVYQHFTSVPSLSVAENLLISRADGPAIINWDAERLKLEQFLAAMPFSVPLDEPVARLAAGEKQKLEILKQLYLGSRFLILDEPTSVLTPAEADQILGHVRSLAEAGQISVLLITHKFREVTRFANEVSVLRAGELVGHGRVDEFSSADMARMMMGDKVINTELTRQLTDGDVFLALTDIKAADRSGSKSIDIEDLRVRAGEIVGIAGVSGNGQTELLEVLTGTRPLSSGTIAVKGKNYYASREQANALNVRYLPEEPLQSACAAKMSVAENLAFRIFDRADSPRRKNRFWKSNRQIKQHAERLIDEFGVKTASAASPIAELSGGNIQRVVLARELTGEVDLLVISNPCFGLDFSAVSAIRERIIEARNKGAAVLLVSEDLDEILALADRIMVMSEGKINFETERAAADIAEIGRYMAGH